MNKTIKRFSFENYLQDFIAINDFTCVKIYKFLSIFSDENLLYVCRTFLRKT